MRHTMPGVDLEKTPEIAKVMQELGGGLEPEQALATAVACYLIDCGAELRHRNNQGKTPLEHIADARIAQMMQKFAQRKMSPPPPLVECMSCCEMSNCVTFEPCGHMIVCIHCSRRMKKCIKCQIVIEHKKMPGGLRVEVSDEDLSILRTRLQEMEDKQMCSICMERPNNLVFDCGHLVCQECAKPLKACHMCRRPIKQRIAMYQ
uniref:RING-type domain-containing protein n=1 Tax=Capitella teleta TaxID=283909 RepID=X1ZA42_CAPTE